jgi:uncharacterized lipoprotein
VKRIPYALLCLLAASSLLTGCNFVHRHFGKKDDIRYRGAVEARPLEVPPDLDTPNGSGALVVPPVATQKSGATTATASSGAASATATSASSPPALAAGAGVALSGDGLAVADTVDSVWSRVGLALDRSGAAAIQSRDQNEHTYTVQTTGQTSTHPGWFKKTITLGRAGKKVTARVALTVRVSADGAGSRVSIEGASNEASKDAARALLEALRQRLS